jgi:hypothetical protein
VSTSPARTPADRPVAPHAHAHEPLAVELTLTPDQVDVIAERVADMVAEQPSAADCWLRGAKRIAEYIDAPVSRVYSLTSAGRIPVEHDGSNLIARKSRLDAWVCAGGGKRP